MYQIKMGEQVYTTRHPNWREQRVKLKQEFMLPATAKRATGIEWQGMVYQLADRPLMQGEFEVAEVTWVDEPVVPVVMAAEQVQPNFGERLEALETAVKEFSSVPARLQAVETGFETLGTSLVQDNAQLMEQATLSSSTNSTRG